MIRRLFNFAIFSIGALAMIFLLWFAVLMVQRPSRKPLDQPLFQGVHYLRRAFTEPRPVMVHIIEIDYTAPGVSFYVTSGEPELEGGHEFLAQKTSTFLRKNGLNVAVNGDFFAPFEANNPFDFYPHEGDPVSVNGFSISKSTVYARPKQARPVFCVQKRQVTIEKFICPPDTLHAVSGYPLFFENGELIPERLTPAYYTEPGPRTVVATSETGQRVWLLVIDGRQPGYSSGMGDGLLRAT